MKFYFPDSQDLVSPTYDFLQDEYLPTRVRQRDDVYAHEVVTPLPYDGILVSKAIVDPSAARGAGKYAAPQRARLYRLGVRRFFRLPESMVSLGDCGAFNYIDEEYPPYSIDEVLNFYDGCRFDAGVSIDHVIFGYRPGVPDDFIDEAWRKRRTISLDLAEKFIAAVAERDTGLEPVGAAQGWSPESYADSVAQLAEMGYRRVALGGMVPLKTDEIVACLVEITERLGENRPHLHLLGINRLDSMSTFADYGVTSFDSTSVFRQAFMDDRNNYHTDESTFTAIRVPQVDGNPALKRRVLAGKVSQSAAIHAERECLALLRAYDQGGVDVEEVLAALTVYERLVLGDDTKKKSYIASYRRTLEEKPWQDCPCGLCRAHGIEIVVFRGTERNKRRGFHNLSVLEAKMRRLQFPGDRGDDAAEARSTRG
ncbi:tRNA-guanine transglycosylase DpdA [Actinokineospora inagensis]|uniref:tRNA-guanine transglycosylase DpdA n=1 Tax=Actinokineospora inagensis TaxID=103730 RepID=UPI0004142563|nr:tRNA-guanine transglycosylase DpdA [Actinokineospora inagensis]